ERHITRPRWDAPQAGRLSAAEPAYCRWHDAHDRLYCRGGSAAACAVVAVLGTRSHADPRLLGCSRCPARRRPAAGHSLVKARNALAPLSQRREFVPPDRLLWYGLLRR